MKVFMKDGKEIECSFDEFEKLVKMGYVEIDKPDPNKVNAIVVKSIKKERIDWRARIDKIVEIIKVKPGITITQLQKDIGLIPSGGYNKVITDKLEQRDNVILTNNGFGNIRRVWYDSETLSSNYKPTKKINNISKTWFWVKVREMIVESGTTGMKLNEVFSKLGVPYSTGMERVKHQLKTTKKIVKKGSRWFNKECVLINSGVAMGFPIAPKPIKSKKIRRKDRPELTKWRKTRGSFICTRTNELSKSKNISKKEAMVIASQEWKDNPILTLEPVKKKEYKGLKEKSKYEIDRDIKKDRFDKACRIREKHGYSLEYALTLVDQERESKKEIRPTKNKEYQYNFPSIPPMPEEATARLKQMIKNRIQYNNSKITFFDVQSICESYCGEWDNNMWERFILNFCAIETQNKIFSYFNIKGKFKIVESGNNNYKKHIIFRKGVI